jgi:hypothetical protein
MIREIATALALASALQLGMAPVAQAVTSGSALDAGTRMFLTLDEEVSSARGGGDVGTMVGCRVWRDVENRGVVFIKAGTPATCRVDKVKRRNMGGTQGQVSVGGVETRSVDGQLVMLSGGYRKEGSGRKAVVWTVGLLLLWPVLFVPGGNAELPPGTVFDVSTVNTLRLEDSARATPRVVNLAALGSGLTADFMLDDFLDQPKHDTFRIKVSKDGGLPSKLVIDNVNGKPIEAIPLTVTNVETVGGDSSGVAAIGAKVLAKHFARGINRFEVAYTEDGKRAAAEVVMDVQM